jgi:Na+/proline symporter
LDGRVTIAAVLVVTLAYTAYGGLRASLETDRWQAWLLIILLLATAAAMLLAIRKPVQAVSGSGLLSVDGNRVSIAITLVIAVTTANMFHQGYWQRVWAARDGRALIRGAVIGIVTSFIAVTLVGLLGLLAAAEGLPLGSPPTPFFALLKTAPAWLTLVVLVLTIALVASSVDTLESGLAALVTAELPAVSLAGARWITVLFMVPAALVAIKGYSVLRLFLIADLLCTTAVIPALLGLWKRTTAGAALTGAVAGVIGAVAPGWIATGSFAKGVQLATFPGAEPTLPPFLGALVVSAVITVLLSISTRKTVDLEQLGDGLPELSKGR